MLCLERISDSELQKIWTVDSVGIGDDEPVMDFNSSLTVVKNFEEADIC